jgi:hypothetical protein
VPKFAGKLRLPSTIGVEADVGDAVEVGWPFDISLQYGGNSFRSEPSDKEAKLEHDVLTRSRATLGAGDGAALIVRSHQNHCEALSEQILGLSPAVLASAHEQSVPIF